VEAAEDRVRKQELGTVEDRVAPEGEIVVESGRGTEPLQLGNEGQPVRCRLARRLEIDPLTVQGAGAEQEHQQGERSADGATHENRQRHEDGQGHEGRQVEPGHTEQIDEGIDTDDVGGLDQPRLARLAGSRHDLHLHHHQGGQDQKSRADSQGRSPAPLSVLGQPGQSESHHQDGKGLVVAPEDEVGGAQGVATEQAVDLQRRRAEKDADAARQQE
jgi:hypothetical protein